MIISQDGQTATGPIRQNLDIGELTRTTGLAFRPLSIQQTDDATDALPAKADGLLRHWPAFSVDISKHQGYAFQWFALCALIAGLYAWFQWIRPRHVQAK